MTVDPRRKWRAITVATLVLLPAFWALLTGLVSAATTKADAPNAATGFLVGIALVPFTYLTLALMSGRTNPANAVLKGMGLALLVGIPVSALAGDAVTGIVAGIGAGGIPALAAGDERAWRARALGVTFATLYTFVLVRTAGALVLLPAPVFPLTALGLADHLRERRAMPL